jgi:ornithine carbamoyltransferase
MTRHVLDVTDLAVDELRRVIDLAGVEPSELGSPLRVDGVARGVALVFQKPSLRTRQSMEMAVAQLGGHPVTSRDDEIGFDVRESVEDITRILCGFHSIVAARVHDHTVLARMAAVADRPVVNMLSDRSHPLQALADVLTMEHVFGHVSGRTVAWIGDYNNVARSLAEACAMLGARVRFACPVGFGPSEAEVERLTVLGQHEIAVSSRPHDVVAGADAVHTDTWVSMGDEAEAARRERAFEGFTIDASVMAAAPSHAVFLHCLPAHRGVEVSADVIDGPQSLVVAQGHNRLHAARGLLAFLAASQAASQAGEGST